MSPTADLPNIAEVVGRVLQRVPRAQQPLLIALAERLAAERYRGWANEVTEPDQRSGLLACADREEEIARRVEALYPAAASIQRDLLAGNSDLVEINRSLFAGYALDQQFILQAHGEHLGAATWRAFATEDGNPEAANAFLVCALLEEQSAAFLESISAIPASQFIESVTRGDLSGIEAALDQQPELASARDQAGVSVVCLAIYHGREDVAARLVRQRTRLDLFEASCVGDAKQAERLLDAHPDLVNSRSPDGFQALGFACFFGRREVFELLVSRGAELEAPAENAMRVRPIHGAVAHADATAACDLAGRLLALGVSPNVSQQGGFQPLHEAALRGHAELVALLLRHGADRNAENDAGKTALDLARSKGHVTVVRLLES